MHTEKDASFVSTAFCCLASPYVLDVYIVCTLCELDSVDLPINVFKVIIIINIIINIIIIIIRIIIIIILI